MDQYQTDAEFNATIARMLHREALRRAAQDMNSSFGPGLENVLARISAEATAEAAERIAAPGVATPDNKTADPTSISVHSASAALKDDDGEMI